MAKAETVVASTGYMLGGVSPIAQKKRLSTLIDTSAKQFTTVYVSAGKRGLEVALSPSDLAELTQGKFADVSV
jgi:Cys-tRNA(Pro)/Cys-tRNA(Cys) deacylase